MLQKILLLDTGRQEIETLREVLEKRGFEVIAAYGAGEAKRRLRDKVFHCVVFGAKIVAEMGQSLFDALDPEMPDVDGLVIVNSPPPEGVLAAVRRRGYRLLEGSVSPSGLLAALARETSEEETDAGFRENRDGPRAELLGDSPVMRRLRETLLAVARADATALLRGETGTGKELAARFIHRHSSRSKARWVAVNCAALSETLLESELFGHEKGAFTGAHRQKLGKFEYAGRGTLFLDEIGDMSPRLQAEMLRVVDDRQFERVGGNRTLQVECRVIAASNIDFSKALAEGRFRADLYHRLNVVSVELPPLRQRPEDIPVLVRHFLGRCAAKYGRPVAHVAARELDRLGGYSWPGNVRELENVIERGVILAKGDCLENLPFPDGEGREPSPVLPFLEDVERLTLRDLRKEVLGQCEKHYFDRLLRAHGGHVSRAAAAAGVDRKTFYRKIREYGVEPAHYKKRNRPE